MIAIVSSSPRECVALAGLCAQRGWNSVECNSVRAAKRMIGRLPLRVMLVRYQLCDGYSDDIISSLSNPKTSQPIRVIVLLPAGTSSSIEARQLEMGADCVQRDPVRSEVLLAYLAKYIRRPFRDGHPVQSKTIEFLGATFSPLDRTLRQGDCSLLLTPREAMLVEMLATSIGQVVSYELLYNEILGRKFNGDTSNMRVLLAKLSTSTQQIGLTLRGSVTVIPKSGYRYIPQESPMGHPV